MSDFRTSCSLAETVKGRGGQREEGRRGGREGVRRERRSERVSECEGVRE